MGFDLWFHEWYHSFTLESWMKNCSELAGIEPVECWVRLVLEGIVLLVLWNQSPQKVVFEQELLVSVGQTRREKSDLAPLIWQRPPVNQGNCSKTFQSWCNRCDCVCGYTWLYYVILQSTPPINGSIWEPRELGTSFFWLKAALCAWDPGRPFGAPLRLGTKFRGSPGLTRIKLAVQVPSHRTSGFRHRKRGILMYIYIIIYI